MNSNSIPTDEDFRRASAEIDHEQRGLGEVRSALLKRFSDDGLEQTLIFYSPAKDSFGAYLFFTNERVRAQAEKSGLVDVIKDSVLTQLERVGRGKLATLNVTFEIDTDENVQRNFEGDYYLRLR